MPNYFEPSRGGNAVTEFSRKLTGNIAKMGVGATRPLTVKELIALRGDGPANMLFYDGKPQPYIRDLTVAKRTRKVSASLRLDG